MRFLRTLASRCNGAFLRRAFRDPIARDTLVSRSRPGEREVRFVTARLPVSVATFTDARAAARRVVRALSHRCPVASAFGLVAPSPRSGGWHAHFILTVPTIAPSVARQVETSTGAQLIVQLGRRPYEVGRWKRCGGSSYRRHPDFRSPRAADVILGVNVSTVAYVAAQMPEAVRAAFPDRSPVILHHLEGFAAAPATPSRRATPATHRRSRSRPPAAPRRPSRSRGRPPRGTGLRLDPPPVLEDHDGAGSAVSSTATLSCAPGSDGPGRHPGFPVMKRQTGTCSSTTLRGHTYSHTAQSPITLFVSDHPTPRAEVPRYIPAHHRTGVPRAALPDCRSAHAPPGPTAAGLGLGPQAAPDAPGPALGLPPLRPLLVPTRPARRSARMKP